jgi:peptidoglycan hydrolase-like amidase
LQPDQTPSLLQTKLTHRRRGRRLAGRHRLAGAIGGLVAVALAGGLTPAGQPTASAASVPSSFTITGAGYGHGIGLSQYGAQAQALAGRTTAQILSYYYTGASVGSKAAGWVKVQLRQASTVVVRYTGAAGLAGAATVAQGKAITLSVSGSNVVATGGSTTASGTTLNLTWNGSNNCSGYVTVDGTSGTKGYCRGTLIASVIGGQVNLSAQLRLTDEYLYGLAEMPSSWSAEALKAQAIAGRSFAYNQAYKSSCDCHVYSDTRSQAYTGRAKEVEGPSDNGYYGNLWKAAVNATFSGSNGSMVVNSAGSVLTAY